MNVCLFSRSVFHKQISIVQQLFKSNENYLRNKNKMDLKSMAVCFILLYQLQTLMWFTVAACALLTSQGKKSVPQGTVRCGSIDRVYMIYTGLKTWVTIVWSFLSQYLVGSEKGRLWKTTSGLHTAF